MSHSFLKLGQGPGPFEDIDGSRVPKGVEGLSFFQGLRLRLKTAPKRLEVVFVQGLDSSGEDVVIRLPFSKCSLLCTDGTGTILFFPDLFLCPDK